MRYRTPEDLAVTAPAGDLDPCPKCGKREGELIDSGRTRFRYYVTCKACPFMTHLAKTSAVAVKLWNEAKPAQMKRPARGGPS